MGDSFATSFGIDVIDKLAYEIESATRVDPQGARQPIEDAPHGCLRTVALFACQIPWVRGYWTTENTDVHGFRRGRVFSGNPKIPIPSTGTGTAHPHSGQND